MSIPVLSAAGGSAWEADLLGELEVGEHAIVVVRRCVDVVDLLAVAASGVAVAVLVDARLRRLDTDAVDRLVAAGVVVVGIAAVDDVQFGLDSAHLQSVGVGHVVPSDADAGVFAATVLSALSDGANPSPSRAYADPVFATGQLTVRPVDAEGAVEDSASLAEPVAKQGSVVAVWGPTGAPGRTTVAVTLADELSRLPVSALVVDADVYGGVVSSVLGLLDESPGVAAACRQAQSRRLDRASLAGLAWQINPNLRVLTGLPRADRWPELKTTAIDALLTVSRALAEFTVVDVGFSLESDEELSFDTLAPRRNGATLAVLDGADLILAVASADPIGIQRLVRGLSDLREAEVSAPVWIVMNRVRRGVVPGDPVTELDAALRRFAGQSSAALLPYDRPGLDSALAVGKTLAEVAPGSQLRRSVRELAAAVAGVPVPEGGRRRKADISS
ncbi:AAA family ATPase [Jatrophihabitans sp. DSM 45814]